MPTYIELVSQVITQGSQPLYKMMKESGRQSGCTSLRLMSSLPNNIVSSPPVRLNTRPGVVLRKKTQHNFSKKLLEGGFSPKSLDLATLCW